MSTKSKISFDIDTDRKEHLKEIAERQDLKVGYILRRLVEEVTDGNLIVGLGILVFSKDQIKPEEIIDKIWRDDISQDEALRLINKYGKQERNR